MSKEETHVEPVDEATETSDDNIENPVIEEVENPVIEEKPAVVEKPTIAEKTTDADIKVLPDNREGLSGLDNLDLGLDDMKLFN